MLGTLSEFTLAQLLQLFALSEKSGALVVHAAQRHVRLTIESDRVVGMGGTETDAHREALQLELMPATVRTNLASLSPRPDTPGLSLLAGNMLDPARWEHYVARRFEQDVYPLLNETDGAFEITVERSPFAPIRVSTSVQQIILEGSRWEAETEALRSEGYHLDRVWARATAARTDGASYSRATWLVWASLARPASIADIGRRLGIPDLVTATAVRRLHGEGALQGGA